MCPGAVSSDYQCSADVTGKQTDGCHDNGVDAGVGPMQPVVHVTCSDVTSPETDAGGTGLHLLSVVFITERLQHCQVV